MIKMAQLEDIRKMYFMEDLSIREISRRTGIHRDTISKYLATDEPIPHVVILDELGYIPFSKTGAELLFQFCSARYERGSLIITSNLEFPK